MTVTTTHPLAVVDARSRFAALALAWRTGADDRPTEAPEESRARRDAVGRALLDAGPDAPVDVSWSLSAGADRVTLVLPQEHAARSALRLAAVVQDHLPAGGTDLVAAVVGDADVVAATTALTARTAPPAGPVVSAMQQTRVEGFEKVRVTGGDPAPVVGHAAVFLALCRATAGPGSLVPAALAGAGLRASVQAVRGLHGADPALTWHVVTAAGDAQRALETLAATLTDQRVVADPAAVDASREFARANLRRAWRSPHDLAGSLAEYEVMGWGGHLLLDPDAALDAVEGADVARAAAATVRPVADVLGWEG